MHSLFSDLENNLETLLCHDRERQCWVLAVHGIEMCGLW